MSDRMNEADVLAGMSDAALPFLEIMSDLDSVRFRDSDADNSEDAYEPPIYDVRLDAGTDGDKRDYRLRVTAGGEMGGLDGKQWQRVLDGAKRHDMTVTIQNHGIELT